MIIKFERNSVISSVTFFTACAGQTNSPIDTSQRKFPEPELTYGLAKGGQTDSRVAKSHTFHANTVDLRSTRGTQVENLR